GAVYGAHAVSRRHHPPGDFGWPMTLFATLTLCALAHYARVQSSRWLYAAGLCLGLTFLAKETGLILLAAVYLFFALSPSIKARLIDLIIATALCFALVSVFPLVISLAGATRTGQNYLVWTTAAATQPQLGVLRHHRVAHDWPVAGV
ncbi:MAG: hypothetical protein HC853_15950, partial [Anaerolineae bacterium]|nr:hypothetical protein [Anaerolineae bacterium]